MGIEPTSEVWENSCLEFQSGKKKADLQGVPKPLLFVALNQHLAAQGQLNQRGLW